MPVYKRWGVNSPCNQHPCPAEKCRVSVWAYMLFPLDFKLKYLCESIFSVPLFFCFYFPVSSPIFNFNFFCMNRLIPLQDNGRESKVGNWHRKICSNQQLWKKRMDSGGREWRLEFLLVSTLQLPVSFISVMEACPVTRVQTSVINCTFLLFMIMIYIQANYSTFQY